MIALVVGTVLAVAALAYVLYPLFFAPEGQNSALPPVRPADHGDDREIAVAALREIEFDRATGKLSDADYASLKQRYAQQAIAAMRRDAGAGAGVEAGAAVAELSTDDAIEAAVAAYRKQRRACPTCGPRPESDAVFCSNCGHYLPGRCAHCGDPVTQSGARFCASCGHGLAA